MNDEENDDTQGEAGGNDDATRTGAATPDLEEHRDTITNALGAAAEQKGIPFAALASQLGLSTDDMNGLSQGDLMTAAKHLAAEHPEMVQSLIAKLPMGNMLGGFVTQFLSR